MSPYGDMPLFLFHLLEYMDDGHELGDRARGWIEGIKGQFRSVPVEDPAEAQIPAPEPFRFKML